MGSGIRIRDGYIPLCIYSAPSELESVGSCRPPVSPEVIHIPPLCGEKSLWDNLYLYKSIIIQ